MKIPAFCILLIPTVLSAFCFDDAGNEYGINPLLLETIAKVESNFTPNVVHKNKNGTCDIGIMQINSSWTKRFDLNTEDLIRDPCLNARTGARILRLCIDKYGYTWQAVGCYNATSKGKRVNYSWKILHALKETNSRDRQLVAKKEQNVKHCQDTISVTDPPTANNGWHTTNHPSSLFFAVRDKQDLDQEHP